MVPWRQLQFTWNGNWKNSLWSFLRKSCHVLAVGVLEITIILKRDSGIQIFLNGDVLLNGSWVDLDGTLKRRVEGQLLFKERGISEAWRSGQKTLDMWANCVLKHCLSLKTFIPNFVIFLVSLGIVISCIRKMSFSVTSAKREFMPAIVSLSTSREVDKYIYVYILNTKHWILNFR